MVTCFQSHGAASDLDDLAREFVAQHGAGGDAEGGFSRHVQVAAADAAPSNTNHHLIC